MYVAFLVGCLVAEDPQPQQCTSFSAKGLFSSYDECLAEVTTNGILFANQQGYYVIDVQCVPVRGFGDGDV